MFKQIGVKRSNKFKYNTLNISCEIMIRLMPNDASLGGPQAPNQPLIQF